VLTLKVAALTGKVLKVSFSSCCTCFVQEVHSSASWCHLFAATCTAISLLGPLSFLCVIASAFSLTVSASVVIGYTPPRLFHRANQSAATCPLRLSYHAVGTVGQDSASPDCTHGDSTHSRGRCYAPVETAAAPPESVGLEARCSPVASQR